MKKLFFIIAITLTACNTMQPPSRGAVGNEIGNNSEKKIFPSIDVPPVPDDWEYEECPHYVDWLEGCRIAIPRPQNQGFEIQDSGRNAAISLATYPNGDAHTYIYWLSNAYYRFSFEELSQCGYSRSIGWKGDCKITVRYINEFLTHSIMAYEVDSAPKYHYYIRLPDAILGIAADADPEHIHLVDTSLLNLRVLPDTGMNSHSSGL